jgi:hypothetical protein
MKATIFEEKFKVADRSIDSTIYFGEISRSLDPDYLYIGKPGTRNLVIVCEELAELSQQVAKELRGKGDKLHLIEEIGDVYMALDYLKLITNVSNDEINKAINVKLDLLLSTKDLYR